MGKGSFFFLDPVRDGWQLGRRECWQFGLEVVRIGGATGNLGRMGVGVMEVEVAEGMVGLEGWGWPDLEVVGSVEEGLGILRKRVAEGLRLDRRGRWMRLEVEVRGDKGVLDLVRRSCESVEERFYYRSRGGSLELGGFGFAWMCRSLESLAGVPEVPRGVNIYVATKFDASRERGDDWEDFGGEGIVFIPVVEYRSDGSLALNADQDDPDSVGRCLEVLDAMLESCHRPIQTWNAPKTVWSQGTSNEQWTSAIEAIKQSFKAGKSSKIVLARTLNFHCAEAPADPFGLLPLLDELTPRCFLFGLQPKRGQVFVGCSPEQLFLLQGGKLLTESLAGTCRVGDSRREAVESIINSQKDRYEQDLVTKHIVSVLKRCGAGSVEGAHDIVHQPHLVHLRTKLTATLPNWTLLDNVRSLLKNLNPTPAVCGLPTDFAMAKLAELEPFDRGLYSGPLGYVGQRSSEFCVSIRSALISGRKMTVYAGAGIVPDSDPQLEWKETALKMMPFVQLLAKVNAEEAFAVAVTDKKNDEVPPFGDSESDSSV